MDLATVLTASGVGVSVDGETARGDHEESDASDAEDDAIKPSDAVLLVAHTEEEYSCVEVRRTTKERQTRRASRHRSARVPARARVDPGPTVGGGGGRADLGASFVAVGTFKPGIEIWNLDVLDPLEPTAVLGGEQPGAQPSKPRGKHADAAPHLRRSLTAATRTP